MFIRLQTEYITVFKNKIACIILALYTSASTTGNRSRSIEAKTIRSSAVTRNIGYNINRVREKGATIFSTITLAIILSRFLPL